MIVSDEYIECLESIADSERRIVALEKAVRDTKLLLEEHEYQAKAHAQNAHHARSVLEDRERQLSAERGACLALYHERDAQGAN